MKSLDRVRQIVDLGIEVSHGRTFKPDPRITFYVLGFFQDGAIEYADNTYHVATRHGKRGKILHAKMSEILQLEGIELNKMYQKRGIELETHIIIMPNRNYYMFRLPCRFYLRFRKE